MAAMAQTAEWWRGSVTYQIYPRSFMDSNGDGVGDLPGIISRLDHIAGLGVDAIWLSPIFRSPMKDMGYDVSDYLDIDPTFGTLADFDALIARAHDLGLKVIIDQVLNHSSDQHPFFKESRRSKDNDKADWYVWADPLPDGSPPNNWKSVFGGPAWEWEPRRRQYFLHNFLVSQPDLNFHNPAVQDYALSVMKFWLDRGVDGFRLDTVNFYFHDAKLRSDPPNPFLAPGETKGIPYYMQYHVHSKNQPENLRFLERMRALLDQYDGRTMVGEVGESFHAVEMMAEYTSGKRLHMAYSFEMLGYNFTPAHFRKQIVDFFQAGPKGWPCWAFSNHDVCRHASRWADKGAPEEVAKLAAALLLSLEGSVCLYQGEEFGQLETELSYDELLDPQGITFWPEDKGRDGCRTPMVWDHADAGGGFTTGRPWLPIKPPQRAHAADLQGPDGVLDFYKRMLALRKGSADLRAAKTVFLDTADPVLAFRRGSTLCVFNLSDAAVPYDVPAGFSVVLAQNYSGAGLGPSGFVIGVLA